MYRGEAHGLFKPVENGEVNGWQSWYQAKTDEKGGPHFAVLGSTELLPQDHDQSGKAQETDDGHVCQLCVKLK